MSLKSLIGARGARVAMAGVMLATTMLAGCQTTNRYGADYSNDVCAAQRDALQETGNHFAEDILAGAVKGAAMGLAAGALTAVVTGGDVGRAMVTGLAVGVAVGFGSGYFNALAKQSGQTPTGLFSVFQADLDRDAERLAQTQAAFDSLIACRSQEIATVKSAVKNKSMTKADGEVKMAEIRQKISEDRRVAKEIMGNVEDRSAQYAVAGAKFGDANSKKRAQTYAKKTNEKVDVDTVVAAKDKSSAEYKKMNASLTSYNASVDKLEKSDAQLAKLEGNMQFSLLPVIELDVAAMPACHADAL